MWREFGHAANLHNDLLGLERRESLFADGYRVSPGLQLVDAEVARAICCDRGFGIRALVVHDDFRICDHSTVSVINSSTNGAIGGGLCIDQRAAGGDKQRYCD